MIDKGVDVSRWPVLHIPHYQCTYMQPVMRDENESTTGILSLIEAEGGRFRLIF